MNQMQVLDAFAWTWLGLAALSTLYVAIDQFRGNPETTVMKWGFDVVWTAREPGKWLLHCHIPHHTTNNNVEQQDGGGLMLIIDVS